MANYKEPNLENLGSFPSTSLNCFLKTIRCRSSYP